MIHMFTYTYIFHMRGVLRESKYGKLSRLTNRGNMVTSLIIALLNFLCGLIILVWIVLIINCYVDLTLYCIPYFQYHTYFSYPLPMWHQILWLPSANVTYHTLATQCQCDIPYFGCLYLMKCYLQFYADLEKLALNLLEEFFIPLNKYINFVHLKYFFGSSIY